MFEQMKKAREEEGFTLIELLITIVVVGILAAVVVLSISGLTNTGSTSACTTSKDAAVAASHVFYANKQPSPRWPENFTEMSTVMDTSATGVAVTDTTIKHGSDWTLTGTFSADGSTEPSFVCS